jgi:nucleoside-diphosphate-sugar epimerase
MAAQRCGGGKIMRTALVTGCTGFVGSALAKLLLSRGITVFGAMRNTGRQEEFCKHGDFIAIKADFDSYAELPKLLKDAELDCVYHTAWAGTSNDTYNDFSLQANNLKASYDVVQSAKLLNAKKIISIGSQYSYAKILNTDINPTYYGSIKHSAAEIIKTFSHKNNIPACVVYLPHAFGPFGKANSASAIFIKKMLKNESLDLINGDRKDDWIYIDDVAEALYLAGKNTNTYSDYYAGNVEITTFKEKLFEIKNILQSKSELNFGKYRDSSFIDYTVFNLTALYGDTGFVANPDFARQIKATASYWKQSS